MNKCICDYIEIILGQIKYKKIHKSISYEIENHINELSEEYISTGMNEEEAIKKAIAQMGQPVEIGKKLNDIHRPKPEWSIITLVFMAAAFGLYIMFTYSNTYTSTNYFYKQLTYAGLGVIVFCFFYFIDYIRLEKYSVYLYMALTLLLFLCLLSNSHVNGKTYLYVLGRMIDQEAVAIPFLLISYSGILKNWCNGKIIDMLKLVLISLLPVFAFLLQPSLANAVIIGTGFLVMISFGIYDKSFAGNRKKFIISLYGSITGFFILFVVFSLMKAPYMLKRFVVFLNPQRDPQGAGYLGLLIRKLLSSSRFIGNSMNLVSSNGNQVNMLPGGNSEFIFTFIVSVFGWLLGIALIFLLSLLILRMFISTGKISDRYGKYLSIGICCVFSLQIVSNILMNLGFIPLTGIVLPFISYGGGNFLCNAALLGLFLGVYRRKDIILKKPFSV